MATEQTAAVILHNALTVTHYRTDTLYIYFSSREQNKITSREKERDQHPRASWFGARGISSRPDKTRSRGPWAAACMQHNSDCKGRPPPPPPGALLIQ